MAPLSRGLAIVLLLGHALGCSSWKGDGAGSREVAPGSGAEPSPFRLVITGSSRDLAPQGDTWASFDARVEMKDGTPVPEGRWYFEAPRMGEDVILHEERWLPAGNVIGPPSGFSTAVRFHFRGLRPDEDVIRRMVIDIPLLEVLEGDSETLRIDEGTEVQRRLGPLYVSVIGQDSSVSVFLMDQGEEVPSEPFYSGTTRPQEHAWSMVDARGLPLVDAGGGGSSVLSEYRYLTSMTGDGPVEFPVTLHWRIPRKWRTTMQRFVLEDVHLGPILGAPGVPSEGEWDRELPAGRQLECLWSDDQSAAEDAAEDALDVTRKEWDLRVARGEDAGPEPTFQKPQLVSLNPVRVVDDATGEPVPNARIENWWEADTPHAEPWEELREGSWTTDQDGWALIPARDHAPWYFVEAPGYAPMGEMGLLEDYRLVRGRDFVLEVRDWQGRPVPNATVDLILGCGHTPNARCETTGPDGRLTFRCVDDRHGDLWIRAAGVAGRNDAYGGWDDLPEAGGIRVLRCDPSPVLEGLVLRSDGVPAAGARVGTRNAHRGPWTVAGPDGRYRLIGALPHDDLIAMAPYSDPVPEGFMSPQVEFQTVPGVFTTVRLPVEGKKWPTPEERDAEREKARHEREAYDKGEERETEVPADGPGVRIRVAAAPGLLPFGRVRIVLVRDGDGVVHETAPRFKAGIAVRAVAAGLGTWRVTAGDPAGLLRPESKTVEVKEGWADVSFTLGPNPTWKPRLLERSTDGKDVEFASPRSGTFFISSEDGDDEATPHMGEDGVFDGAIYVPATGLFAVEYRAEDGRRARVLLDEPPSDAGPALVLPAPRPAGNEKEYGPRSRSLPKSSIKVRLPDGRPAADAYVDVLSRELPDPQAPGVPRGDEWCLYPDAQGTVEASFDVGDRLTVKPRGDADAVLLPFEVRITGPGPWELDWPTGEVVVRAVDETGSPLREFAVVLGQRGSDAVDAVDGMVHLRGASKGPLRLWVGAAGRRIHDLRMILKEGQKREVLVRMGPAWSGTGR